MTGLKIPRRLGVNIDHVATVRQARRSPYPDPVEAARVAEQAGADQITCHIRCDRRHVNERDIRLLRQVVQTQLNVECAATDEMLTLMEELRPHRVTLVPERPEEITTEGGLDLRRVLDEVTAASRRLHAAGIQVALFIDPIPEVVQLSALHGVDQIELNTAAYADEPDTANQIQRLATATAIGEGVGLTVAAGHGLTHHNLPLLVANVPSIEEYNIGHSIISRALFVGMDTAVRDLKQML